MATRAPTISLKFDDGSGTYPIDMTSRLNQDTISYAPYGRADETTTAGTNTLSFRLNNNDGALSSGGSQITVGQGVRLTYTVGATTVDQFTGRVQAAPIAWQGGPGKRNDLMVTAVDLTAELNRRTMRSLIEQEILLDNPTAYYTLGEAEGSTSAGDTSGNQDPAATITGSGAAMTFGTGVGPSDGLPAASFAGGMYLNAVGPVSPWVPLSGSFSFECVMASAPGNGSVAASMLSIDQSSNRFGSESVFLAAGTSGASIIAGGDGVLTSINLYDGDLHHVAGTYDHSTHTLTGYIDGVNVGTKTVTDTTLSLDRLKIGADHLTTFTGSISHVALYATVLSGARIASHAAVALGTASETTDARLTRLASYLGRTPSILSPSGQVMGSQPTSGQTFYQAMSDVATAEGGVLFVDGSGTIVMQGRYYRAQQTTAALALTGKDVDPQTTPSLDDTQLINKATVTRTSGASQVAVNQTSINSIGEYPETLDLAVDTDANALGRAQWDVAKHATPGARMPTVTFNMLTSANRETLVGAKIGDRVALSAMPGQQFAGLADLTIEGWSDSLSINGSSPSWARTINFLPWSLSRAFILDSATYGKLDDASCVLGY